MDAVEPALIEAVARGFERQMLDAALRELGEQGVQPDRVGRGQPRGAATARRDQPERPERGRRLTERGPELHREAGDRGLAAGAGHRDDGARLAAIEAGRDQRQAAARIGVEHQRHAELGPGEIGRGEDHAGAARDRIGNEPAAIGPAAGQGREQPARLHRARIGAEAGDLDRGRGRASGGALHRHPRTEQAAQPHPGSPWWSSTHLAPTAALKLGSIRPVRPL